VSGLNVSSDGPGGGVSSWRAMLGSDCGAASDCGTSAFGVSAGALSLDSTSGFAVD
jgi:hypothetical protein